MVSFFSRDFVKKAEEIGASRRMNSLTLNRHTEILEILEIPQLMDTCVRNGYYEEALELAAYAKRLEKKHSALPVIQVSPAAPARCSDGAGPDRLKNESIVNRRKGPGRLL